MSTAISSDTIIVGALNDVNGGVPTGAAYIFVRSGGVWTQQAKLLASDGAANDMFGWSVSIEGDTAVVGAWGDDHSGASNKGSVYVYNRTDTSWVETAKVTAANTSAFACFGRALMLRGDTLIVGAFGDSLAAGDTAGSAFAYVRSGTTWIQQFKFTASDASADDNFGLSVAISGETALIGAHRDDHLGLADGGSAYVFIRSGNSWTQQAKLIASDAGIDDFFGYNLALFGNVALIGSLTFGGGLGAEGAYIFRRSGSTWTQETKLVASDGTIDDGFGVDVDIDGDFAIVGSYSDDHTGGVNAGSAYVFRHNSGNWTQVAKLTAGDAATGDQFGWFVSIHDDVAIVSARYDDHSGGVDAGSAYVFDLSCTAPCCRGDFDNNNLVNASDLAGMVDSVLIGYTCAGMPTCCIGDLDDNGIVNGSDISGFVNKFVTGGACN